MAEMKTLNGFEIVDAKAREDISALQEAVENMPEGGSGGKTVVTIRSDETEPVNPEVIQHINDLWAYAATGKNPLEKYDFQYFDVNNKETYKLLWVRYYQGWFESYMFKNTELYKLLYGPDTYGDRIFFEYHGNIKSTLTDWSEQALDYLGNWVIGWCGEFALMAKLTVDGEEFYINSHVVLCNGNWADLLYDHTNEKFLFNMPANLDTAAPYWYWDGEKLVFDANGNTCELVKVFVKGQYA